VIVTVSAEKLCQFAAALLAACGVPEGDAATAAGILVEADLRGVHSHGVLGLLVYAKRLRAGGMVPRASITVAADHGAALLLDGGNGLGQAVGAAAMGRAISRARETGVALVGVRNSNHLGMNGAYAMMALPHDMVGFVTNAGSGNLLAPWGGVEALLGTNPIAIAVPAGEELPPVLDMAMSQVSKGKITLAAARGDASIPAGWALNRRGEPTTDTREAMQGLLVPIGSYKGAGLSFMTGLLAGVWVGGLFGRQVLLFEGRRDQIGIHAVQDEVHAPLPELEEPDVRVGDELHHDLPDRGRIAEISVEPGKVDRLVAPEVVDPEGTGSDRRRVGRHGGPARHDPADQTGEKRRERRREPEQDGPIVGGFDPGDRRVPVPVGGAVRRVEDPFEGGAHVGRGKLPPVVEPDSLAQPEEELGRAFFLPAPGEVGDRISRGVHPDQGGVGHL